MKLRLLLVALSALALTLVNLRTTAANHGQAAPALLQLPWPAGSQHRINTGNQTYSCGSTHQGSNANAIDFEFSIGQAVGVAASGTVADGDNLPPFDDRGAFLELDHGNQYRTRYLHLSATNPWAPGIAIGITVAQGQVIGYSGNTPNVDPHLHFDMKLNGNAHKPEPMSWVVGFGGYGLCTGVTSPYWASRPPASLVMSGDYNGDGRTELAVWRPGPATWHAKDALTGALIVDNVQWGDTPSGDIPVPGDYNGDGRAELAVWRPGPGTWHAKDALNGALIVNNVQWGISTDIPVPGDYNGDGRADLGVWRPGPGTWHVKDAVTGAVILNEVQWGNSTDIPVPGDYDGDGKTDLAVWRPGPATWHAVDPFPPYAFNVNNVQWGLSTDIPVPGDYNSGGRTELAVWRPGPAKWYMKDALTGGCIVDCNGVQWGFFDDVPVPGAYNGGRVALGVWRPGPAPTWHVKDAPTGAVILNNVQWGLLTDVPLAGHRPR